VDLQEYQYRLSLGERITRSMKAIASDGVVCPGRFCRDFESQSMIENIDLESLSRRWDLAAYDAAYLHLAQRTNLRTARRRIAA